jgi:hypothetical protein
VTQQDISYTECHINIKDTVICRLLLGFALSTCLFKNVIFWDVTPCGTCKNRRFGGTYRLHHQGGKNRQVRNNVGPSSSILVTQMMQAIRSSET